MKLLYRETEKQGSIDSGNRRIRCPKCKWEPTAKSRWQCVCKYVWNTFDTRGLCPGCDAKWANTKCLACKQWSPHEAWYP